MTGFTVSSFHKMVAPGIESMLERISCALRNKNQGPVVQSTVSLTSSLRGQLVKYFTTL